MVEPATRYVHGWHIDAIAKHLEAITFGRFLAMGLENRLLINVPPGTMKSLETSVFWPAWEWGPAGHPGESYLTTSFAERFARRDSRKMRDLVQSDWYRERWPEIVLTRDGEMSFANSLGGFREAAPFTSLTGGRGSRVILDDPHSTETVESDAQLATTTRVFRESLTERLNDKVTSAIIVDMQRLRQKDISGVILDLKFPYQHVMLPMEFEPERRCHTAIFEDPRTYEGELLFPERFPREVVDRDKIALGAYGVAGQYQQRPSPRGGLMFKRHWFQMVDAAPFHCTWVRGYDFAGTKDEGAARSAGVKMGSVGYGASRRFYIGHCVAVREMGEQVRKMVLSTAEQDGRMTIIDVPQDPGQAGKVQAQDFVAMLAGYQVVASRETGDKITRAQPVASQAEAGNIFLVRGPWNNEFLDEVETFPTGKLKDIVDAMSRAFGRLLLNPGGVVSAPIVVTAQRPTFGDHPGT